MTRALARGFVGGLLLAALITVACREHRRDTQPRNPTWRDDGRHGWAA